MIYHSIILNFGLSPLSEDLTNLLKKSYPDAVHPNRIAGFNSSRLCLLESLRYLHPEAQLSELQMKSHSDLIFYPDVTLSLSHSPVAGACALASKKDYLSIGLDIESEKRVVKESIIQRVSGPKDLKLSPLKTWCLKEAIYKCVSNSSLYQGVLEFRDLEIFDKKWFHSPSGLNGEWKLFSEKKHQVAIATLKSQNS